MARFHAPPVPQSVGDRLAERGFLARETDPSRVDVILLGGSFRYTPAFWQHVGAVAPVEGGLGWRVLAATEAERTRIRALFAEAWEAAGATPGWARMEASAALDSLLAGGLSQPAS
jgi:hypothetical protein